MAQPPNASILDQFADLEDPRVERTRRHKLLDIIAIAICATICGPRRFKLPEHMPADEPETENDIHENSPSVVPPWQLPPGDEDYATCGDDVEPGILLHDDRELSPGRIGPKVQVSRLNLLHISVPGEEGRSGQEGGAHGQTDQKPLRVSIYADRRVPQEWMPLSVTSRTRAESLSMWLGDWHRYWSSPI